MNPALAALVKSLTGTFLSIATPKITNSKAFRDLKSVWSKDNYTSKTLAIFSAAIADAKALSKLPDDLIVELLDDPINREEIFRWILEGVQSGEIAREQLVLEPYMERYPRYQDQMFSLFTNILKKLNEYKVIHWDPADLEIISRLDQIENDTKDGLNLIEMKQDQLMEVINRKVEELKSLAPNETFREQIITMLQGNDLQAAEKQMASLIRMMANAHLEPDWRYDVSYDGSGYTILEKPLNEDVIESLEKRIEVKIAIPDRYKSFQNFAQIIQYGRQKQIPVKLELQEFKMYAGDHLIERKKSEFEGNLVLEIPPIPFPIIKTKMIIGEEFIDNSWIQIVEVIDDNKIVVSNKNQPGSEIEYEFTYSLETQESTNFHFRLPAGKEKRVKTNILFNRILSLSQESVAFKMVDPDNTESVGFSAIINSNPDLEGIEEENRILEMMSNIEIFFLVTIELPEKLQKDTERFIIGLDEVISQLKSSDRDSTKIDEIELAEYPTNISDLELLEQYIIRLEEGNSIDTIGTGRADFPILGFNFVIDFTINMPPLRIKDFDLIKRKVAIMTEGDSVKVTFIPFADDHKTATYHYINHSYTKMSISK